MVTLFLQVLWIRSIWKVPHSFIFHFLANGESSDTQDFQGGDLEGGKLGNSSGILVFKASPDLINKFSLKYNSISFWVKYLFLGLENGCIPDSWKTAWGSDYDVVFSIQKLCRKPSEASSNSVNSLMTNWSQILIYKWVPSYQQKYLDNL